MDIGVTLTSHRGAEDLAHHLLLEVRMFDCF